MRLKNRAASVTGAASGIGRSMALGFAQEGAKVGVADVNGEGGHETVMLIGKRGGEAAFLHTGVSVSADARKMVGVTVRSLGGIHVLVNNAACLKDFKAAVDTTDLAP